MEIFETKGYQFDWPVAQGGYELVNRKLYVCKQKPISDNLLYKYNPNHIFLKTQLLSRRWHGELQPDAIDIAPPWLVPKQGQLYKGKEYEFPAPTKFYTPLNDEPTLHRKFANLRIANFESHVIQFANRFGLLGRPVQLHPMLNGLPVNGESLFRWQTEIDKMGVLLSIWDLVEREEAGKLGQIVLWPSHESVIVRFKWRSQKGLFEILPWNKNDYDSLSQDYDYSIEYKRKSDYAYVEQVLADDEVLPRDEKPSPFFKKYRMGDILGPARHYLCDVINYHLHGITPTLVPGLAYKVTFRPDSLLDALWLMFMLEVNGQIRTCWHCRSPFISTRKDNVYCSKNCKRLAHYYAKERKANPDDELNNQTEATQIE